MATRSALALIVVLVLAGCGGTAVPEDGTTPTLTPVRVPQETAAPTPSPTPTPDPTATPSAPSGELVAPGLTTGGVTDAFALARAHRNSLRSEPYILTRTLTIDRVTDGTRLRHTSRRVHVGTGGVPYSYTENGSNDPAYPVRSVVPRLDLWFDGGVAYFRLVEDGGVEYQRDLDVAGTGPLSDLTLRDRLVGLISSADLRVVGRVADDDRRYRVAATRFATRSVFRVPTFLAAPRNVSLAMVVTDEGRIERYRLRYDATYEGERVTVVRTARFETDVSPVTEPPWVARAVNATRPS
jgi:hypothetical protein